ncbi:hypothetical protein [Ruegeria sp.]|uniref:hypothetical protein n=1 Tax=Ruegeria sp. TaxID=1879320 RepID=UPI003C7DBAA4
MIEILPHIIDGGMGMLALTGALYLVIQSQRERREVLEPLAEAIRELLVKIDQLNSYREPGE